MQSSREPTLAQAELAAWRGLLRVHAELVREFDRDLETAHGLPLHAYEVLLVLAGAEDGRLRMSDVADRVLFSHSGLTRLVDRLEQAGLVTRERCEQDRRGLYARITAAGRERFTAARVTHLAGVRTRFLDHFTSGELAGLADAWARVVPDTAG